MLNIEDAQVDNLANFMRHAKEIHKSIYQMPIPIKEMTDVSWLLKAAMGTDLDDNNIEDCDNAFDTDNASQISTISEEIAQTNNYIPDSDNDSFDNNTTQDSFHDHTTNNLHSEHHNSEFHVFHCSIFIYMIYI